MKNHIVIFLLLFITHYAWASEAQVKVMALFNGKALLLIDGERKVVSKGETVKGITLLSANGRGASIRTEQGKQLMLGINQSIQHGYKKRKNKKLTVYPDRAGMYMLRGQINGQPTRFLLDTGASYIALSEVEADRLGIAYESGRKGRVHTASETVPVWNIRLDSVKVGGISVPHVDAVILQGDSPRHALLGMSFLKHLNLERNGSAMVLEQKYP